MAAARKCDRCGKCFDPLSEKGEMARFMNPYFQTAESIQKCMVYRRLLTNVDSDGLVDLCPECTKDFVTFMDERSGNHAV